MKLKLRELGNANLFMYFQILYKLYLRFPAKANIHSPILPSKHPDKERDAYQATRGKPIEDDINQILRAV